MAVKPFKFSVVDMRSSATGEFVAEAASIDAAFKQPGLRMFRFRFEGEEVFAAWSDLLKGARDQFRPKNDGRLRPPHGFCVLLPAIVKPAAANDDQKNIYAKGRVVSRSIESFESDETYDQEQCRLAAEAERKRLQELQAARGGRAA